MRRPQYSQLRPVSTSVDRDMDDLTESLDGMMTLSHDDPSFKEGLKYLVAQRYIPCAHERDIAPTVDLLYAYVYGRGLSEKRRKDAARRVAHFVVHAQVMKLEYTSTLVWICVGFVKALVKAREGLAREFVEELTGLISNTFQSLWVSASRKADAIERHDTDVAVDVENLRFICGFIGDLYSNECTSCIGTKEFNAAIAFVLRTAPPQGPVLFHVFLFDFLSRGLIYTWGHHSGRALALDTWREVSALWRKICGDPTNNISVAIRIFMEDAKDALGRASFRLAQACCVPWEQWRGFERPTNLKELCEYVRWYARDQAKIEKERARLAKQECEVLTDNLRGIEISPEMDGIVDSFPTMKL
ncbi:hypothetical protein FA13DRAFT_1718450 [Coprinellus micaceus]|uniref:Uncharacterized protein n=1 Tax=Coprinellus micaceus TaxID=71717 RepID=A0A4Y7SDI0_COPMI|nr:hypothetical protein FA13DRAFT_1718450 [Coprinellus micaceus]